MPLLPRPPQRGFTLLEALATAAIAAVLAILTLPSLHAPLQKARRSDGGTALMHLQLRQEQWRASHPRYAALADLGAATLSPRAHYRLEVVDPDAQGYTLLATATGLQQDDLRCRVLRLRVADGELQRSSGPDAGTLNPPADNRQCWGS
jgi:type IV pilus assembly protein PilE